MAWSPLTNPSSGVDSGVPSHFSLNFEEYVPRPDTSGIESPGVSHVSGFTTPEPFNYDEWWASRPFLDKLVYVDPWTGFRLQVPELPPEVYLARCVISNLREIVKEAKEKEDYSKFLEDSNWFFGVRDQIMFERRILKEEKKKEDYLEFFEFNFLFN